jgi:hypothetical protein
VEEMNLRYIVRTFEIVVLGYIVKILKEFYSTQKGLAEWLKCGALSSNSSTTKKKKLSSLQMPLTSLSLKAALESRLLLNNRS